MSQTSIFIITLIVTFLNLLFIGAATIIFFSLKQYMKSSKEDIHRLYKGLTEQTQLLNDFKIDFSQRYAEKETQVRLETKVNGIDKGLTYIAAKQDMDMAELAAVTNPGK